MTESGGASKGRVIVFGILFWYPLPGVTYQFLHYLLGLRRLGYDAYYVEDSGRWPYDPRINAFSPDASHNVARIAPILEDFGFEDRWAFRGNYPGGDCFGMTEEQILRLYRESDAFLNVTGAQEIRDEHLLCPRRILVESDPFPTQVRAAQGHEATLTWLEVHDTLFTFGENLGATDCQVPVGEFRWLPTRQPVALDLWERSAQSDERSLYTTVTTWHNKGKDIDFEGETYFWTKDREFKKFIDLPQRSSRKFELAVSPDREGRRILTDHGWRIADSMEISASLERYRDYIQQSRGELTAARDQYVRPRTGWFSDRSACYLAAGRPVITQATGFDEFLPTGRGLFEFSSTEDILAAIDCIESDYEGNCRAAREIAAAYFGTENVLASLLERAGLQ